VDDARTPLIISGPVPEGVEDNGEPAAFSPEALAMMLNVMGVGSILFNAYLKDCGAKEKN
jgi:hypothetical protein